MEPKVIRRWITRDGHVEYVLSRDDAGLMFQAIDVSEDGDGACVDLAIDLETVDEALAILQRARVVMKEQGAAASNPVAEACELDEFEDGEEADEAEESEEEGELDESDDTDED